jgi:hypothetical protein
MPIHKLNSAWTKIASAGVNVSVTNIGLVQVQISKRAYGGGEPLPPSGSYNVSEISTDLWARADDPKAEILTTITPCMPRDM